MKLKHTISNYRYLLGAILFLLTSVLLVFFVPPTELYTIAVFNINVALGLLLLLIHYKAPRWIMPIPVFLGVILFLQSIALLTPFHLLLVLALAIGTVILLR